MQAIEFQNQLHYRTDYPQPTAKPGEALIKIKLAGICATDLEIVKGYAGYKGVLGHEFVGIVEKTGSAEDNAWLGKRIVGSINLPCYRCQNCLKQQTNHCQQRQVLGIRNKQGAFADYITLPIANLYQVPEQISDQSAVFTEPLAAACRILQQITIDDKLKIAVLGAGKLGLLIGKVLSVNYADIIMLGRSEQSLKQAHYWGLKTGQAQQFSDNHFDIVIEATGNAQGFEQALRLTKSQGTLILKSTFASPNPIDLTKVVVSEITLLGSRCGPFDQALKLLQLNLIPVETVIDGEYHFKNAIAAFDYAAQPGVKKVLLKP